MSQEFSAVEFKSLREDISELRTAMTKVAEALERLARLEEKHNSSATQIDRAFLEISKVDVKVSANEARLNALEMLQPATKRSSEWLERVAYGAMAVVAMVILKKVGLV